MLVDIIKKNKQDLVIINRDLPDIPKPYEREIYLFSTYVAGTTHIDDIDEVVTSLNLEDCLEFYREPQNTYDKMAISVKTKNKEKLGYLPKGDNPIFARLLDAGKLLFGKVKRIQKRGNWHKIDIDIYLKD